MMEERDTPKAFQALLESVAEPIRVRLLKLLERNELGVQELCQVLHLPQSTVSRHLKVLLDQGWLENRVQRTARFYRMRPEAARWRLWHVLKEQAHSWPMIRQDGLQLERLLARRRGSVQAFFKGAARHWDRLRGDLYGHHLAEATIPALLPPEWLLADLGCGTGQMTAALAPHVRRVIGVDQSQAMLAAAARRTAGLSNVELRKGSLEAIPIDDGACDGAVLLLVLSYVPDPLRVLQEAARILRPGGRLVVTDLLRHDREAFRREMGQEHLGWEPSEMQRLLEEAGFGKPICRPLPPEPEARGPALVLASAARGDRSVHLTENREESR